MLPRVLAVTRSNGDKHFYQTNNADDATMNALGNIIHDGDGYIEYWINPPIRGEGEYAQVLDVDNNWWPLESAEQMADFIMLSE